jgi:hypothetical protein
MKMAKPKITINVTQGTDGLGTAMHVVAYRVVKTTNTTDPKVDDWLTEADAKDLIRCGVTFNITK